MEDYFLKDALDAEEAEALLATSNSRIDEEIREELEAQGWQKAGREFAFRTRFNSATGLFEDVRVMTEEEIKEKYLVEHGNYGFDEVRVVVSHHTQTGWPRKSMVYVYMRRPQDIPM